MSDPNAIISLYAQQRGSDLAEVFQEGLKFFPATLPAFLIRTNRYLRTPGSATKSRSHHKAYEFFPTIELPEAAPRRTGLADALQRRTSVRGYLPQPCTLQALANVLRPALDATRPAHPGEPAHFRPYASGGGLYPIECYVALLGVAGQRPAIAHYNPLLKRLARISDIEPDQVFSLLLGDTEFVRNAAFIVFLTAAFQRSCEKYGPRGYLFSLLEAGEICQSLALTCVSEDLGTVMWGGYYDDGVNTLLEVNGVDETVVATLIAGVARHE
jgi:SagB-type dehydrogenase family enzyme